MSSIHAAPITPSKRHETAEVVQQYNQTYGLEIRVPDHSLTPSRRKQLSDQDRQYARSDRICRAFGFLYYNGDLKKVHDNFYLEARAAAQAWIPASNTDPPRARTEGQRLMLEEILEKLLHDAQEMAKPSPKNPFSPPSKSIISYPDLPPPGPATSQRSKRPSPDVRLEAQKRAKGLIHRNSELYDSDFDGSDEQALLLEAIQSVPSVRQKETSPSPLFRSVNNQSRVSGAGSSKWSLAQSVFTEAESFDTGPTQSTLELNTQDKRNLPIREAASSSSAYDVTSSGPRSLEQAFSPPEAQETVSRGPIHQNPGLARVPSSPALSTVYSSCSGLADLAMPETKPVDEDIESFELVDANIDPPDSRLSGVWPKFPPCLDGAPFAVAWEITRICRHCGVDPDSLPRYFNPEWNSTDVLGLWKCLRKLPLFQGKAFPEAPSAEAWTAALNNFQSRGRAVVLSVAIDFNKDVSAPLFTVNLKPFTLDSSCRLTRRFGADRFLEIVIPALSNNPVKEVEPRTIVAWLTQPHRLVGRQWMPFYTVDLGFKKLVGDFSLEADASKRGHFRIYLFAEDGPQFHHLRGSHVPATNEPIGKRSRYRASDMLDWLLQFDMNYDQPYLKLFSRIQLGLTKAFPILEFQPDQIIQQKKDIRSLTDKVMNDGIGRMSRSVARKISQVLGLSDIPSAIQGRLGPAKGMWLMDIEDSSDKDWIETFPSQRKWKYDMLNADACQRTLEVKAYAKSLVSAALNLQLLPVLEDRGDLNVMRAAIRDRLREGLQEEFDGQKTALKHPVLFRQYVHERRRPSRLDSGIPFLGGLPDNKNETLSFLLDSGFDPTKQKYLQDIAFELQRQHCDTLKSKMKIPVGRSAYMYMVVDFWGCLEEDEVHVNFSTKFQDSTSGFSDTSLDNLDVLVARSPAHFPSDIQRVKAVYKSELRPLKDVIVFSRKGNIPLAHKLSGGDYDGDKAWVCWDPDIVASFVNADMPDEPDLSQYLKKDKTTFGDLVCLSQTQGRGKSDRQGRKESRVLGIMQMIEKAFEFNLRGNFLGIATNYKERYCYHNRSVSSPEAILLSSLVGNLVDQTKQGILFGPKEWALLREEHFKETASYGKEPAYKTDNWSGTNDSRTAHIIDYLKFLVARPAIEEELKILNNTMNSNSSKGHGSFEEEAGAHLWDKDLVEPYKAFENLGRKSRSCKALLDGLKKDVEKVYDQWRALMGSTSDSRGYPAKVATLYEEFSNIQPPDLANMFESTQTPSLDIVVDDAVARSRPIGSRVDSKMAIWLREEWLPDPENSQWALLRASTAFNKYYRTNHKFVWQMAGRQLAAIKALMTARRGEVPVMVASGMYAALMPDKKYAKQLAAREDGDGGSEYSRGLEVAEEGRNFGDTDYGSNGDEEVYYDAFDSRA